MQPVVVSVQLLFILQPAGHCRSMQEIPPHVTLQSHDVAHDSVASHANVPLQSILHDAGPHVMSSPPHESEPVHSIVVGTFDVMLPEHAIWPEQSTTQLDALPQSIPFWQPSSPQSISHGMPAGQRTMFMQPNVVQVIVHTPATHVPFAFAHAV